MATTSIAEILGEVPVKRGRQKRKRHTDPVIRQIEDHAKGKKDVVSVKAHLLNEANQQKISDYIEEKSTELTIFDLQGGVGMAGLRRFSSVLCANVNSLTRVSLRANNLGLPAVLDICCALQFPHNGTLQLLDLSSNPLGSDGFRTLMQKLLLNTSVSALLLSNCQIGDAGVEDSSLYLSGKAVPVSKRFYVNLSRNVIGSAGHTAITKHLPSWMSISLTRQRPPVLLPSSPAQSPQKTPMLKIEDMEDDEDDDDIQDEKKSAENEKRGEDEDEEGSEEQSEGGESDADAMAEEHEEANEEAKKADLADQEAVAAVLEEGVEEEEEMAVQEEGGEGDDDDDEDEDEAEAEVVEVPVQEPVVPVKKVMKKRVRRVVKVL